MPEKDDQQPAQPDGGPSGAFVPAPSREADIRAMHRRAGRIPPQATDVEQSVLGAMLLEREAIPRAIEILTAESFYSAKHKKIYGAICGLFERGNPVDLITLSEELRRRGDLEDIGGAYYLTELTTQVASAANVEYHARIIAEKYLLREMIETMTMLVGEAYDPGSDAFELLDRAEADIFSISDTQMRRPAASITDVIKTTLQHLEAVHGREGGVTGVPSGFSRLDDYTSGFQKSDLVVIAARPSMGKTAFALTAARNAALHPQRPTGVVIFSLEMGAEQLAQRLLTSEARINAQAARTGRMKDRDWQALARAAGRLSEAPIFIDDTPGLSVLELRAKSRRLKAEHDIGMIIVDYLQLMHATPTSRNANREQEIAQISRSLKSLAKEINVPVIALSQLSRAVETRGGDKRPQLSDLRESGSIEQDADVVCFIYRAERYGITVDENGNSTEGLAEVIIGKQRNGPIGTVQLAFVDQYARFENLTTYYQPPDAGGGDGFSAPPVGDDEAPF